MQEEDGKFSEPLGTVTELEPVVLYGKTEPLKFNEKRLLELNICTGRTTKMTTSLIAKTGTFIHSICSGPCQGFDSNTVISYIPCNTAYPICSLSTSLASQMDKVYVLVQAESGVKTPGSDEYTAIMNFAASFKG